MLYVFFFFKQKTAYEMRISDWSSDVLSSDLSYEDESFDLFKSDKEKKLPFYFRKYANKNHAAIDLGCGIGKAFPYLSPAFKKVFAVDISDKCLNKIGRPSCRSRVSQ